MVLAQAESVGQSSGLVEMGEARLKFAQVKLVGILSRLVSGDNPDRDNASR